MMKKISRVDIMLFLTLFFFVNFLILSSPLFFSFIFMDASYLDYFAVAFRIGIVIGTLAGIYGVICHLIIY